MTFYSLLLVEFWLCFRKKTYHFFFILYCHYRPQCSWDVNRLKCMPRCLQCSLIFANGLPGLLFFGESSNPLLSIGISKRLQCDPASDHGGIGFTTHNTSKECDKCIERAVNGASCCILALRKCQNLHWNFGMGWTNRFENFRWKDVLISFELQFEWKYSPLLVEHKKVTRFFCIRMKVDGNS